MTRLTTAMLLVLVTLPAQATTTSALQCGHLFDSRDGRTLGPHTVVVRDGKVAEVLAGRTAVYKQPGAIQP